MNEEQTIIDRWTLGGGTALMLHINHRESHDVDIFVQDHQLLPFLNPAIRDFEYEIMPTNYSSDGHGFPKFAFEGIGEIDFIAAPELTEDATVQRNIEGKSTLLETAPEIIAKKIYYRGSNITPRDIFDLAAAGKVYADAIVRSLSQYQERVKATLATMEKLRPEFVRNAISQLMIQDDYTNLVDSALDDAKTLLNSVSR